MDTIATATVGLQTIPLKSPYALSFTTLTSYEVVVVELQLASGDTLVGEATALPSYSWETVDSITATLEPLLKKIIGETLNSARCIAAAEVGSSPFAMSAVCGPIDQFLLLDDAKYTPVPLVYPVSTTDPNLAEKIQSAIAKGYTTIKIKTGARFEADFKALPTLLKCARTDVKYRFDANQGFSKSQAVQFLGELERSVGQFTELLEQPLPANAWEDLATLTGTSIPIMLDESITALADIDRAAEIGARWIKLKLCKQGGLLEVIEHATRAKQLGISVVFGNGVATDVSNLFELKLQSTRPELFDGASESNGFAKLQRPLLHPDLTVRDGFAVV